MDNLTIEMFSEGKDYNFRDFDCGEPSLNVFLTEHLVRQHNGRILLGYLLKESWAITRCLVVALKKRCCLLRLSSVGSLIATYRA